MVTVVQDTPGVRTTPHNTIIINNSVFKMSHDSSSRTSISTSYNSRIISTSYNSRSISTSYNSRSSSINYNSSSSINYNNSINYSTSYNINSSYNNLQIKIKPLEARVKYLFTFKREIAKGQTPLTEAQDRGTIVPGEDSGGRAEHTSRPHQFA